MTTQIRFEVIKALARGISKAEAAKMFGVELSDVETITESEIESGKERLRKWGRL